MTRWLSLVLTTFPGGLVPLCSVQNAWRIQADGVFVEHGRLDLHQTKPTLGACRPHCLLYDWRAPPDLGFDQLLGGTELASLDPKSRTESISFPGQNSFRSTRSRSREGSASGVCPSGPLANTMSLFLRGSLSGAAHLTASRCFLFRLRRADVPAGTRPTRSPFAQAVGGWWRFARAG